MGPSSHLLFGAFKTAHLAPEILVSIGPSPHLWFLSAKQRLLDQNYNSLWVPALSCDFCIQNGEFRSRITRVYESTSPSPHLWCCDFKTAYLAPELQVSIGSRPHLSFCACKAAWLAPELLVSMDHSLHLWFCAFKIANLGPELWVPDLACGFVNAKSVLSTKMTSLYGLHPSPVVLCMQNHDFQIKPTGLYGSQTSSVDLRTHNRVLNTWISSRYGFQPSPVVLFKKNSYFRTKITRLCGSQT